MEGFVTELVRLIEEDDEEGAAGGAGGGERGVVVEASVLFEPNDVHATCHGTACVVNLGVQVFPS